jgi:hypothetical protein
MLSTLKLSALMAIALGAGLAGALMAYSFSLPALLDVYDRISPVATLNFEVLSRTADSVTMKLSGERHEARKGCTYKGIFAFTRHGALLRDVNIVRIDRPAPGLTKPPGLHDFGTWMLWPVEGVSAMVIYTQYNCTGRDVLVYSKEIRL